jgi:hypothetical protein
VQSDAQGRVRVEKWRDGDVPLLVSAPGFVSAVVTAASLDGGVQLAPARRVAFVTDEPQLVVSTTPPAGFPPALWGDREALEQPADAGFELPAGEQAVIVSSARWSAGRQVVAADAGTLVVRAPPGAALGVGTMFGDETQLDVFPGAPLTDDELRTRKRLERFHFWCFAQPTEPACVTAPLPPGPATVVLSPPERAKGPLLVWRVEIPKSGVVLLQPPADARAY